MFSSNRNTTLATFVMSKGLPLTSAIYTSLYALQWPISWLGPASTFLIASDAVWHKKAFCQCSLKSIRTTTVHEYSILPSLYYHTFSTERTGGDFFAVLGVATVSMWMQSYFTACKQTTLHKPWKTDRQIGTEQLWELNILRDTHWAPE